MKNRGFKLQLITVAVVVVLFWLLTAMYGVWDDDGSVNSGTGGTAGANPDGSKTTIVYLSDDE